MTYDPDEHRITLLSRRPRTHSANGPILEPIENETEEEDQDE